MERLSLASYLLCGLTRPVCGPASAASRVQAPGAGAGATPRCGGRAHPGREGAGGEVGLGLAGSAIPIIAAGGGTAHEHGLRHRRGRGQLVWQPIRAVGGRRAGSTPVGLGTLTTRRGGLRARGREEQVRRHGGGADEPLRHQRPSSPSMAGIGPQIVIRWPSTHKGRSLASVAIPHRGEVRGSEAGGRSPASPSRHPAGRIARRAATMSTCSGSAYAGHRLGVAHELASAVLLALAVAGVAVWKSNRAEGAPYRPRAGGTSIAERNS